MCSQSKKARHGGPCREAGLARHISQAKSGCGGPRDLCTGRGVSLEAQGGGGSCVRRLASRGRRAPSSGPGTWCTRGRPRRRPSASVTPTGYGSGRAAAVVADAWAAPPGRSRRCPAGGAGWPLPLLPLGRWHDEGAQLGTRREDAMEAREIAPGGRDEGRELLEELGAGHGKVGLTVGHRSLHLVGEAAAFELVQARVGDGSSGAVVAEAIERLPVARTHSRGGVQREALEGGAELLGRLLHKGSRARGRRSAGSRGAPARRSEGGRARCARAAPRGRSRGARARPCAAPWTQGPAGGSRGPARTGGLGRLAPPPHSVPAGGKLRPGAHAGGPAGARRPGVCPPRGAGRRGHGPRCVRGSRRQGRAPRGAGSRRREARHGEPCRDAGLPRHAAKSKPEGGPEALAPARGPPGAPREHRISGRRPASHGRPGGR
jgi:hypothetical protein